MRLRVAWGCPRVGMQAPLGSRGLLRAGSVVFVQGGRGGASCAGGRASAPGRRGRAAVGGRGRRAAPGRAAASTAGGCRWRSCAGCGSTGRAGTLFRVRAASPAESGPRPRSRARGGGLVAGSRGGRPGCGAGAGRGSRGGELVGGPGGGARPGQLGVSAGLGGDPVGEAALRGGEVVLHLGEDALGGDGRVAGDQPGGAAGADQADGAAAAVDGLAPPRLLRWRTIKRRSRSRRPGRRAG